MRPHVTPRSRTSAVRLPTALLAGLIVASSMGGFAVVRIPAAGAAVRASEDCYRPKMPRTFHRHVVRAIRISRDLPSAWKPWNGAVTTWIDCSHLTLAIPYQPGTTSRSG